MDGFIGEIRAFGFTFAPNGWLACNGQTLPLQQYTALFALIGVQYGGNGTTTFQLPNLNGRATMSQGQGPGLQNNYTVGQPSGQESYALQQLEMPAHNHTLKGKNLTGVNTGLQAVPAANTYLSRLTLTATAPASGYAKPPLTNPTPMAMGTIGVTGSGQAHENRQPLLALNFCICINGTFPSRN